MLLVHTLFRSEHLVLECSFLVNNKRKMGHEFERMQGEKDVLEGLNRGKEGGSDAITSKSQIRKILKIKTLVLFYFFILYLGSGL